MQVLLHKRNQKTPIAHATSIKKTYKSMSLILNAIKNKFSHHWQLCDDLNPLFMEADISTQTADLILS
jgi:hypothetical protein